MPGFVASLSLNNHLLCRDPISRLASVHRSRGRRILFSAYSSTRRCRFFVIHEIHVKHSNPFRSLDTETRNEAFAAAAKCWARKRRDRILQRLDRAIHSFKSQRMSGVKRAIAAAQDRDPSSCALPPPKTKHRESDVWEKARIGSGTRHRRERPRRDRHGARDTAKGRREKRIGYRGEEGECGKREGHGRTARTGANANRNGNASHGVDGGGGGGGGGSGRGSDSDSDHHHQRHRCGVTSSRRHRWIGVSGGRSAAAAVGLLSDLPRQNFSSSRREKREAARARKKEGEAV